MMISNIPSYVPSASCVISIYKQRERYLKKTQAYEKLSKKFNRSTIKIEFATVLNRSNIRYRERDRTNNTETKL